MKTEKRKIFARIISLLLALMLMIPANMDVQAAKGSVKSVTVTNLPAKTLTLKKGKTFQLETTVKKTGDVSKAVTYKSSNTKVATVDSKGKITAKKKGTAKITITSKANSKKKVTITVTVGTPVTKVKLNKTKATLNVGKTLTLKTTLSPSKPSNKKVVWSSSDKKIATVNSKGKVTAVKAGKVKITATAADGSGKKATCTITVTNNVTKVSLNKTKKEILVGDAFTLKATVTPKTADNTELTWSSSDDSIAVVDGNGKVTGIRAGTAKITAKAKDGSKKSASCKVTVKAPTQIESAVIENDRTIKIKLTAADTISTSNLKIKTWLYRKSDTAKELKIDSITTTDSINYTITLNQKYALKKYQIVEIIATNLSGTDSSSIEATYNNGGKSYVYNTYYNCEVNKEMSVYLTESDAAGYMDLSIDTLPEGMKYFTSASNKYTVRFYGTPTKAGKTVTVCKFKDEYGDSYTYNITWNVYSASSLLTSDISQVYSLSDSSSSVYISEHINAVGGSGNYNYEFEGENYGLSLYTSSSGYIYMYGYLSALGTYNMKVRVTDKEDSSKTAVANVKIEVVGSVTISGIVTDALGNPMEDVYVYFENHDENASGYTYDYTDSTGAYSIRMKTGTYDVRFYYQNTNRYLYNVNISQSTTNYNYSFSDLYKVTINSNNVIDSSATWYNEAGSAYDYYGNPYGQGDTLFLEKGSYNLHMNTIEYDAYAKFTVGAQANVVTAQVTKKNIPVLSLDTPVSVTTDNTGVYFKFVPSTSGTYYFYSTGSYDTYGYLCNLSGSSLTSNDDAGSGYNFLMSYYCTAGRAYYVKARAYGSSEINFNVVVSKSKPE